MDYIDYRDVPLEQAYQQYLELADDGRGFDSTTGEPLKTFDEWLDS